MNLSSCLVILSISYKSSKGMATPVGPTSSTAAAVLAAVASCLYRDGFGRRRIKRPRSDSGEARASSDLRLYHAQAAALAIAESSWLAAAELLRLTQFQFMEAAGGEEEIMEVGGSFPLWQALALASVLGWAAAASSFGLSKRVRALTQPCIARRALAGTPSILRLQRAQHGFLSWMFSMISCFVSVPFYTGFLPIVYWSGHRKLARQMTLLIAFCDYIGNSIKDIVSAPRPLSPPVRRVIATEEEKENSMEYGFPSSHCLNTVCLLGYFSHYFLTQDPKASDATVAVVVALLSFFTLLIGIGRMYLGMHSLIDVVAGIIFGVLLLALWLTVHEHVDGFITTGHNVTSFWATLSFLLCFAYPTPEFPTPSFQYHTAFNGVAFGLVSGIQQTHIHSQPENVQILFSSELSIAVFLGRLLVGIPTILVTKICSKAVAQKLLPQVCNTLSIPITSSCYVPKLKGRSKGKPSGHLAKTVGFGPQKAYDVDTGIRFLQYVGLSWSAVVLVPAFFSLLRL